MARVLAMVWVRACRNIVRESSVVPIDSVKSKSPDTCDSDGIVQSGTEVACWPFGHITIGVPRPLSYNLTILLLKLFYLDVK